MTDTSAEFYNQYVDKLKKKYDEQASANIILEVRIEMAIKAVEDANTRFAAEAAKAAQLNVELDAMIRERNEAQSRARAAEDMAAVLNAEADRNTDYVGNLKLEIERLRRDCDQLGGELHASKKMIDDLLAQAAQTKIPTKKKKADTA